MRNLDIKQEYEVVYKFTNIENLYCDLKGNFFYNDKPVKKVYNNGSIAVKIGNSKRGLISLRKQAYKSQKEKIYCPF